MPENGHCEMTRRAATLEENALVIRPTEQCARLTARRAAASVLPLKRGTTHNCFAVTVTDGAELSAGLELTAPAPLLPTVTVAVLPT